MDISGNQLSELPPQIGAFATLTSLNCAANRIASLPGTLCVALLALTHLDVRNNQLTTLPAELGRLPLRDLALSYNRFRTIPECVYYMRALNVLVASNNQIEEIDADGLRALPSLVCLDVSNNNIAQVSVVSMFV